MSKYKFEMVDRDDPEGAARTITLNYEAGEDDTWHPLLEEFFDFLKGCGYVFGTDAHIMIVDGDGKDMNVLNRYEAYQRQERGDDLEWPDEVPF